MGIYIKKKYRGASEHRYETNPRERLFAEHWQQANEAGNSPTTSRPTVIEYALDKSNRGCPIPPITIREDMVAASVIQWLGTPVGWAWLQEVLSDKRIDED